MIVFQRLARGSRPRAGTVWRQADKYGVPRIAFIGLARPRRCRFRRFRRSIHNRLGSAPSSRCRSPSAPGRRTLANAFQGVVDHGDDGVTPAIHPGQPRGRDLSPAALPADLQPEADLWREELLSKLFEYSNELAELVLAEAPVPVDLVRQVLRDATLHRFIVPVLCGSALDFIGIQPLLDAVGVLLAPSPADKRPPVKGTNPKKKDAVEVRKPSPSRSAGTALFKIDADKHGDLHYVRIYSGTLEANSQDVSPTSKDKGRNIPQLYSISRPTAANRCPASRRAISWASSACTAFDHWRSHALRRWHSGDHPGD